MQIGFEGLIILSSVVILSYFAYQTLFDDNLEKVRSSVDDREYLVQEKDDAEEAANLMAEIRRRLMTLSEHVYKAFPEDERVILLKSNFDSNVFREGAEGSGYTSYSLNKGEKIILCLRNKNKLMDINTMMFVVLHELAHLATKSIGHTEEFWSNFRWILEEAINIGIYVKQDFKKENVEYCGMTITSSPLD